MYVIQIKSVFSKRTKPYKSLKLQGLLGVASNVRYFLVTTKICIFNVAYTRPLPDVLSPSRRFSYNDQRSDLSMNEIRVIKDICYDSESALSKCKVSRFH